MTSWRKRVHVGHVRFVATCIGVRHPPRLHGEIGPLYMYPIGMFLCDYS